MTVRNWGWSGSIPVPADYDGDGVTDLAVYDLAKGTWYISESKSGAFTVINWGWSGAAPYPVDYDNDGVDELAVYDAGTGNWYIRYNASTGKTIPFWASGAYAVPGLYIYAGGYDPAIWLASSAAWVVYPDYDAFQWGWSDSWPVNIQTQINRWYAFP